ncbi:hypothetical protein BTVI_50315 [Pitangus sulphuratus]|nr:hypothetical protein BTVI_50315 [Pitangus sulphuratus]
MDFDSKFWPSLNFETGVVVWHVLFFDPVVREFSDQSIPEGKIFALPPEKIMQCDRKHLKVPGKAETKFLKCIPDSQELYSSPKHTLVNMSSSSSSSWLGFANKDLRRTLPTLATSTLVAKKANAR